MMFMKGYKTYIIAFLMALVSLTSVLSGDMTLVEFLNGEDLNTLLLALGLGSVRHAISG